jgi:ABC-type Fe3+-hydroxamate transport system substrate-binding protein
MFRKGIIHSLLIAVMLFAALFGIVQVPAEAAANTAISILVDGKPVSTDVSPQVIKGNTLVPYNSIVAALGGKANWNEKSKTVTIEKDGIKVTYTAGSTSAYKNQEKMTLGTPPVIKNGVLFVPLRNLAESLGMWVKWDPLKKNQITIYSTLKVQTKTGPLTLQKRPERIVTLSSSDTEIVYALGGNVVGRSTALGKVYPAEAESIPEVGNSHSIQFEKLATLKPDLVIASPSLKPQEETIKKLGAQVLFNSHNTFEEIKNSIRLYGEVLGREAAAENLIQTMDRELKEIQKNALKDKPKALILYGATGSFVVALPASYPGNFLELAGGQNVAKDFPKMETMPQYAELSMERIVAADPDIIYLITHGDPDEVKESFKKEMNSNPAWKNLKAVKNDRFEVLPNDLFAANPGLRAPDAILYLYNTLQQVK